jgi:hypothetical protein
MHLSHIEINLDRWYAMGPQERSHRMFNPRRTEEPEMLSPDQSPATSTFEQQRDQDAEVYGMLGHNEQMQFLSRLKQDTTTAYGEVLPRGTVFSCGRTSTLWRTPSRSPHRTGSVRLRAQGCISSASARRRSTTR